MWLSNFELHPQFGYHQSARRRLDHEIYKGCFRLAWISPQTNLNREAIRHGECPKGSRRYIRSPRAARATACSAMPLCHEECAADCFRYSSRH